MGRMLGGALLLVTVGACNRVGYLDPVRPEPWYYGRQDRTEIVYVNAGIVAAAPAPVALPVRQPDEAEKLPPFDGTAAREVLRAADAGECHPTFPSVGYGHAQVTFAPSGSVKRVTIDAPSGLTADVVQCVGNELTAATVPAFRGGDMTVGTGWHWRGS